MPEYRLTRLRGGWAVAVYEGSTRVSRRSLGTDDKAEAKRLLAHWIADTERDRTLTVGAIWQAYRDDRAGRQVSDNMEWSGRSILPFFGDLLPDEVDDDKCRAYVKRRRADGRQNGTIWTELNHLQIAMNWAAKKRMIPYRVSVERPTKPPPRDRRITREEGARLLRSAKMPHVELALALLMSTAGRVGAVLELTWGRVDFDRGLIRLAVEGEEGRKGRATVPITRTLRKRLVAARKAAMTNYVVEWAGEPVKSIRKGFAAACFRAGLENVTPHVLRHSAATWMAEDGVDMEEIAQYLGHRNVATTRAIYARYTPDHLRGAAESLELDDEPEDDDS